MDANDTITMLFGLVVREGIPTLWINTNMQTIFKFGERNSPAN